MLATTAQILARTVDDCLLLSASITPFTGPSEAVIALMPCLTIVFILNISSTLSFRLAVLLIQATPQIL